MKKANVNVKLLLNLSLFFLSMTFFIFLYIFYINSKNIHSFKWLIPLCIISLGILIFIFKVIDYLFKPVATIANYASSISKGNLNISDMPIKSNDDIGVLTRSFNNMKSNLLTFVEQTKNNFLVISDALEKMTKNVEINYKGNEQIAAAVQEISVKTQEQLNLVEKNVQNLDDIFSRVQNIITNISHTEGLANETSLLTSNGIGSINQYNEQMSIISSSLNNTDDFIKELKEKINQINGIIEFINSISVKLKMLALNASIEAARAGESGRGFAVVANETTKLSDATKEGISKITELVTNIMDSSNSVENNINICISNFEKGNEIFGNIDDIFNKIDEQSKVILNQMTDINGETSFILSSAKETKVLNGKLYNASNTVTSNTQELSTITEETLKGLQEINTSSNSLSEMLLRIQKLTSRFNTSIRIVNEKPSKNLKIAVICPIHAEFWNSVKQGVMYAKKELKPLNTEVEWIDIQSLDVNCFKEKIQNCIRDGCNGIALVGFFDEVVPLINSAVDCGIPVMTFNSDFKSDCKRMSFFGQNPYEAGVVAGNTMLKKFNEKAKIGIITSNFSINDHNLRIQGFKDTLKKHCKAEFVFEDECYDDDKISYNKTKEYLNKHSDINGLFISAGGIGGVAKAVEDTGLTGKITIVCFDFIQSTIDYIKKGVIFSSIGQDPFGQGYNPVVYIYNFLVAGQKPENEKMWTRMDVVNSENVNEILL